MLEIKREWIMGGSSSDGRPLDVMEKAKEHFAPVLQKGFGDDLVFMLSENNLNLVRGASVTAVLPLKGFIMLFGDLVEAGDFRIESYTQRNKEKEFFIPEDAFEAWKQAGCLHD